MPYLKYEKLEAKYVNELLDNVDPEKLFPAADPSNAEVRNVFSGDKSGDILTNLLMGEDPDQTVLSDQADMQDKDEAVLPGAGSEKSQDDSVMDLGMEAADDDSSGIEFNQEKEMNPLIRNVNGGVKQEEAGRAVGQMIGQLYGDEGLLSAVNGLKKIADPDSDPGKEECAKIWNKCAAAFSPEKISILQKALDQYNQATDGRNISTPQIKALTGLVHGAAKISSSITQKTADLAMAGFESEEAKRQFETLKKDRKKLKDSCKAFRDPIDFKTIDNDLESYRKEIERTEQEIAAQEKKLKEITSRKEKAEESVSQSRRNIRIQNFRAAYLGRCHAYDELNKAVSENADSKKLGNLTEKFNTALKAEQAAACRINGNQTFEEASEREDIKMAYRLAEQSVQELTKIGKPKDEIYQELMKRCAENMNKAQKVIKNAVADVEAEKNSVESYRRRLGEKKDYLTEKADGLVKARDAHTKMQTDLKDSEKTMEAFQEIRSSCGVKRMDPIMKRMQEMLARIDEHTGDHDNSKEFKKMRKALEKINGKGTRADGNAKWTANAEILKDINESAASYLSKKQRGLFHRKDSVMRNYRLTFARELMDLAAEAGKNVKTAADEYRMICDLKKAGPEELQMNDAVTGFKRSVEKITKEPDKNQKSAQDQVKFVLGEYDKYVQEARERAEAAAKVNAEKEGTEQEAKPEVKPQVKPQVRVLG